MTSHVLESTHSNIGSFGGLVPLLCEGSETRGIAVLEQGNKAKVD
jgi:hypothetical protein